jgi:hypothetical protein
MFFHDGLGFKGLLFYLFIDCGLALAITTRNCVGVALVATHFGFDNVLLSKNGWPQGPPLRFIYMTIGSFEKLLAIPDKSLVDGIDPALKGGHAVTIQGVRNAGIAFDGLDGLYANGCHQAGVALSMTTVEDEDISGLDHLGEVDEFEGPKPLASGHVPVLQTGAGADEWVNTVLQT